MHTRMHARTDGRRTKDCHNSPICALCAQVSQKYLNDLILKDHFKKSIHVYIL